MLEDVQLEDVPGEEVAAIFQSPTIGNSTQKPCKVFSSVSPS